MFVYLMNIVFTGIWAVLFCTGKKTKLKKNLFIVLCFVQCLLISANRKGVGSDYYMYVNAFSSMAQDGFSNLSYEDWEIGYILLNKVIGFFTSEIPVFLAVTSFLTLVGPFFLIWKYSVNPFMSVFLFLNMYLFYMDMNFLRQGIAISIMCFAYGFLRDKKFWRFLLFTIIAATFHFTVLYMIPVYFVSLLKVNLKSMLLYGVGLAIYFIFSNSVLNLLFSKFHTEYAHSIYIRLGVFFYYAIFPLMLCVGMIPLAFYLKDRMSRSMNLLIHMTLMMGFWQAAMIKHALFERFSYYTMFFVILAVPEAINEFRDKYKDDFKARLVKKYGDEVNTSRILLRKADAIPNKVAFAISVSVAVLSFAYNLMGLIVPAGGVHTVLPYCTQQDFNLPNIDNFFIG